MQSSLSINVTHTLYIFHFFWLWQKSSEVKTASATEYRWKVKMLRSKRTAKNGAVENDEKCKMNKKYQWMTDNEWTTSNFNPLFSMWNWVAYFCENDITKDSKRYEDGNGWNGKMVGKTSTQCNDCSAIHFRRNHENEKYGSKLPSISVALKDRFGRKILDGISCRTEFFRGNFATLCFALQIVMSYYFFFVAHVIAAISSHSHFE